MGLARLFLALLASYVPGWCCAGQGQHGFEIGAYATSTVNTVGLCWAATTDVSDYTSFVGKRLHIRAAMPADGECDNSGASTAADGECDFSATSPPQGRIFKISGHVEDWQWPRFGSILRFVERPGGRKLGIIKGISESQTAAQVCKKVYKVGIWWQAEVSICDLLSQIAIARSLPVLAGATPSFLQ